MGASVLTVGDYRTVLADLSARWETPEGRLKLLPASEFQSVPHDHLRLWCHQTARYGIPTVELIEWLKEEIGGRFAIEVGAGNADLGHLLGITSTDSRIQQTPELRAYYALGGQIPTDPPPDVRSMDAITAIKHYSPQVVVASWLTRKFIVGKDREGKAEASIYGPEEEKIIKRCRVYIHIGNDNVHGQKTILSLPHDTYYFPWLVSRAEDQGKNTIKVWRR